MILTRLASILHRRRPIGYPVTGTGVIAHNTQIAGLASLLPKCSQWVRIDGNQTLATVKGTVEFYRAQGIKTLVTVDPTQWDASLASAVRHVRDLAAVVRPDMISTRNEPDLASLDGAAEADKWIACRLESFRGLSFVPWFGGPELAYAPTDALTTTFWSAASARLTARGFRVSGIFDFWSNHGYQSNASSPAASFDFAGTAAAADGLRVLYTEWATGYLQGANMGPQVATITSISAATPSVYTCPSAHGLTDATIVGLSGCTGATGSNGDRWCNVLSGTTFALYTNWTSGGGFTGPYHETGLYGGGGVVHYRTDSWWVTEAAAFINAAASAGAKVCLYQAENNPSAPENSLLASGNASASSLGSAANAGLP